ncbi:MAG: glutathione S-transferase family protein [Deltaproteobacteria bacterium]|nr:glutathione S-transferase family protein [Deltaproteobacteria bacterium]
MKIHDFPFAPNPRKLRTYLGEKGIEIPFVLVNLVNGDQKKPEFLAKNPLGNTPVLELDDGTCLTESLAIIEYLEELHPDPPMIGETPLERARVRRLERIAELGVVSAVARYVHGTKSPLPGIEANPAVAKAALESLAAPLEVLDLETADRPFIAGSRPTIADCTLFAGFEFAKFAGLELGDVAAGFPNLKRWHAAFSQRPSTRVSFPS